jgi:hypothetical protein
VTFVVSKNQNGIEKTPDAVSKQNKKTLNKFLVKKKRLIC